MMDLEAAIALRNAFFKGSYWDKDFPAPKDWKPTGTMRKWFLEHAGKTVDTVQANVSEGVLKNPWQAGSRKIEKVSPSGVTFQGGSVRDFKGSHVIHADANCLAVGFAWGDSIQVAFYLVM